MQTYRPNPAYNEEMQVNLSALKLDDALLESTFYIHWDDCLHDIFRDKLVAMISSKLATEDTPQGRVKVYAPPQPRVYINQVDNDGKIIRKSKFPDFMIFVIRSVLNPGYKDMTFLQRALFGDRLVDLHIRPILVECKMYPELRPSTSSLVELIMQLELQLHPGRTQAEVQVQLHFAQIPYPYVISMVTVGAAWTWRLFRRSSVKPVSINVDGTYRIEDKETDLGTKVPKNASPSTPPATRSKMFQKRWGTYCAHLRF